MLWSPAWHQRSIRGYRMKALIEMSWNVQHRSQSPNKFKPPELLEASEKTSWHHKIPERTVMQYVMEHANFKESDHQFVIICVRLDSLLSHWYLDRTHSHNISAKSIHKITDSRRGVDLQSTSIKCPDQSNRQTSHLILSLFLINLLLQSCIIHLKDRINKWKWLKMLRCKEWDVSS